MNLSKTICLVHTSLWSQGTFKDLGVNILFDLEFLSISELNTCEIYKFKHRYLSSPRAM